LAKTGVLPRNRARTSEKKVVGKELVSALGEKHGGVEGGKI
jgi:hypothetical protein